MWFILATAEAATLTVGAGQAWPTIGAAVGAAVDGDTIEIHAGTYTESVTTPKDLAFVGVGSPTWRAAGGPALLSRGHASVTGLRFDGVQKTLACVRVEGPDRTFTVTNSRFASCTCGVRGEDDIVLEIVDSRFVGNTVGVQAYSAPRLSVETSLFYRNQDALVASAVKLQFHRNVVLDNQGGLEIDDATEGSVLYGNQFCRNRRTGGAHLIVDWGDYGQPNPIRIDQNLFVDNSASVGRGGGLTIDTYYGGEYWVNLTNNTFVGNSGSTASAFFFDATHVTLESNVFAYGAGAGEAFVADAPAYGAGVDVDGDWNLFFDNAGGHLDGVRRSALGPDTLWDVDPMFASWLDDADCTNDDFAPLPGSPLIDAGDPSVTDPDGSRSDIGTVLYP